MNFVFAGFCILFALLFLQVPIAYAMAIVGFAGFAILVGVNPALNMVGQVASDTVLSYDLSVVPLFILMGNFVARSGLSRELYDASNAFLGHRRGGLAMATVIACGGFSAVCGSSVATAATMSKVAMPSMRQYGYADSLGAGSIAAGGTLGILIPPSVVLVIYGAITRTDVGKLFAAGIIPGIIAVLLYVTSISLVTRFNPGLGPSGERRSSRERIRALSRVWGVLVLFILVMGGIYVGIFTPTEAAGIGASGAFGFALFRRSLDFRTLLDVLVESGRTTATIFFVLIGALLFSNFMNVARLPNVIADWVQGLGMTPLLVIFIIIGIYLFLGCVFESLSMMLLTVPVFYPLVSALGFDLIWFGIVIVIVIEMGLITPPIGLNVFILKAMVPDADLVEIFKGIIPFVFANLILLALLLLVPPLALFLPSLMP